MNLKKFRRLLDIYGSDLDRWPQSARRPASELCARSAEAGAMRAAAGRLDTFLRANDPVPAAGIDAERVRHLLAAVERRLQSRRTAVPARRGLVERFARFLRTTPERLRVISRFAAPAVAAVGLGILAEAAIWPSSSDYSTSTSTTFPASVWARGL